MDNGLHILLADPDQQQASTIARFLQGKGHRISMCSSADAVLARLRNPRNMPADLVIASLLLSGMDDLSALEQIRSLERRPPVAVIAPPAGISPRVDAQARSLGCMAVLPNPVPLLELRDLLDRLRMKQKEDDSPFFGTTRMLGRDRETSGGLRQTGSAPFDQGDPRPAADGTGQTGRPAATGASSVTRADERAGSRSMAPRPRPPSFGDPFEAADRRAPPASAHDPTTARRRVRPGSGTVRRSVTGSRRPPTGSVTATSRQVRCAHCGQAFSVPLRKQDFNVICIHCSKINRIPARR
ncbi:MAG: response regulator [Planctomycetota bacterium]